MDVRRSLILAVLELICFMKGRNMALRNVNIQTIAIYLFKFRILVKYYCSEAEIYLD
jgi:hypothetical protein